MTVNASLLVSSGLFVAVSACVSPDLAFDATFAASLVFLARVLFSDLVDGVFADMDDCVQRRARLARVAIGKRAQILRDVVRRRHPLIAPSYALAEERVRRGSAIVADAVGWMKMAAIAKWRGFKDGPSFFWLCLQFDGTFLFNIASDEAKIHLINSSRNEEEAARRGSKPDTTWLVIWISAIVMYITQVLVLESLCSGMATSTSFFGCFTALFGFALIEAERVYNWDFYHVPTMGSSVASRVGNAAGGTAEFSLQLAWESLWFIIILTHFSDACFLRIVLGKRPLALASLAIFKLAAVTFARQIYLTTDDGEEATVPGDGAQGVTNKWHRAATVVLAIDTAKVLTTYLFINFFLGAACFVSLCATAAFLFEEAIGFPYVDASDNDENQDDAGLAMDLTGVPGEQSNEEPGYRSSSSSMDDWTHVDVDPTTPTDVNGGAGRKFSFLSRRIR